MRKRYRARPSRSTGPARTAATASKASYPRSARTAAPIRRCSTRCRGFSTLSPTGFACQPLSTLQPSAFACHLNFAPKERVRIREEDNTMLPIYPNFRPHHGRNEGGSPAMFECKLVASKRQTAFGPLCLLGHYLSQEGVLKPLSSVHIVQKSIKHSPTQKLIDALMGILSGCKALYKIDVRVRPDAPLQRAFGKERCADQSTIQRTLNAFTSENVAQLRQAVEAIGRRYSATFSHDFEREMLVVEVDLTGLRASKRAEGSTKGYFSGERNATGRQLLRVSVPQYKEILFEKLYAGNTTSCEVLKESIRELERILSLAEERQKRRRTLVRLDGGFGTDANLNWLMWRGYEFIAKGYGGTRAKKLASSVAEDGWEEGLTKSQKLGVPASPIVTLAGARR